MAPGPLATALQGHDMFLYFGHGSGDQYLSARYRAADRAIYYYQSHPLHSCLLFREQHKKISPTAVCFLMEASNMSAVIAAGLHVKPGMHIHTHMSLVSVAMMQHESER